MTPILLLRRSRGAIGRVRATPGAPPTAAASMDGSDGRADGIPGGGKGLRLLIQVRLPNLVAPTATTN